MEIKLSAFSAQHRQRCFFISLGPGHPLQVSSPDNRRPTRAVIARLTINAGFLSLESFLELPVRRYQIHSNNLGLAGGYLIDEIVKLFRVEWTLTGKMFLIVVIINVNYGDVTALFGQGV